MKYYYDMHIHSCLSPCGDVDMTPNNIVNMAMLNGLDIIAVSDHNSAKNLPAVMEVAREKDILIVPAIEAESSEEVHLLCLFPALEKALEMGQILEDNLLPIQNRPEIFGEQLILDANDEKIGEVDKLLINATALSIEKIKFIVESMGGVCIPAHIDRTSNSIISNLGFIPPNMDFSALELSRYADDNYGIDENYFYLHNSDAHYLTDIAEKVNTIDICEKTVEQVLKKCRFNK